MGVGDGCRGYDCVWGGDPPQGAPRRSPDPQRRPTHMLRYLDTKLLLAFVAAPLVSCHALPSSNAEPTHHSMAFIEGGSFVGADQRAHAVASFFMSRTEVTVAEYRACVRAGRCPGDVLKNSVGSPCHGGARCPRRLQIRGCNYHKAGRGDHPMTCIGVGQAMNYCAWTGGRLPTEWEWEWAARGRDAARRFPWGLADATCALAVMGSLSTGEAGCGRASTWPVGSRPAGASRDGILDLAGNVSEFVLGDDPSTTSTRGGAFREFLPVGLETSRRSPPRSLSSAFPHSGSHSEVGFRCVASAERPRQTE